MRCIAAPSTASVSSASRRLRHRGGADHVGEEHRHLALLQKDSPLQAAQPGAQRRGGHLDHGIAQGRALGLQRRDGGQHGFDVSGLHVSRSVGC
jgi:hypothetical protein